MARTGWVAAVAGFVCLGAAALGASRSVIASPVGFFVVVILVLTGGVSLVLVGPPGAGKSTVGPLVASSLGLRFVDADEASIPYYEAAGWSLARFAGLIEFAGYERAHLAWEEALAYAAPRLLSDYPDAVIALGAGHTHVTTPARC